MVFIERVEAIIYLQLLYLEQSGHNYKHQLKKNHQEPNDVISAVIKSSIQRRKLFERGNADHRYGKRHAEHICICFGLIFIIIVFGTVNMLTPIY